MRSLLCRFYDKNNIDHHPERQCVKGLGKDLCAPLHAFWAMPTFSTTTLEARELLPFLQFSPTK